MPEPGTQLDIQSIVGGLRLVGDVDAHTAPRLDESLVSLLRSTPTVTIDLAGVDFMDSSGLRVLITATESARADGGDVVLADPTDLVRRLFSISGLTEHLTVTPADDG